MIKYNNNTIYDWNFDTSNVIKVYRNNAIVFYKFSGESPTPEWKVCFAVVDDISQYTDREFEDVYDNATDKWYKLNNLNQYEEYGVYGQGTSSTVTTYKGKLTIDDGYEYEWNGSSWVNLGEVSGSSRLPVGYTEVEYIQNTGHSYIDTNFVPNQDTRIVADMQLATQTDYPRLWGAGAWNSATGINLNYEVGYLQIGWFGSTTWTKFTSVPTNYDRKVYDLNKNYLYVDETLVGSTTYASRTASDHLAIFTYIASGRPSSTQYWNGEFFKGKMYSFQVYNNGTLVRDLVPCVRTSDNEVGAYDIVNDVFYTVPTGYTTDKLIAGAETGTTEYPKYYSEKSYPLNDLTFNTMADAQAYAEANCVYDGMKAIIDGDRYYFDSSDENGWVEYSGTIWLDPSATNALFSIGHYWGENYKMVITTYLSGSYSGDYGSFWQYNEHTPIELSFYSNGFYYDMHNPTSTTAPNVQTADYSDRIIQTGIFGNYQNSQVMEITLTYGSFKAELADSGTLIYSNGSTKTGYSWYDGLYQANIGLNNAYAKCHLSHIQIYNGNNELVNDFKFIKNNGVVGSQEISIYDSVTNTTYNNTNSNTPVYHIET